MSFSLISLKMSHDSSGCEVCRQLARISTDKQNTTHQLIQLRGFCQRQNWAPALSLACAYVD